MQRTPSASYYHTPSEHNGAAMFSLLCAMLWPLTILVPVVFNLVRGGPKLPGPSLPQALVFFLTCGFGLLPASGTSPTATVARATATATPLPPPTSLVVVRLSGFVEQNRVAPFQMTSQDATMVQQLYQAALALPPNQFNPGCPQDVDIGYELSFMHGDAIVRQVMLRGGCPIAELSGLKGCRRWTPDFTAQVASTLGVPVTTLYPPPPSGLFNTAGPNGPFVGAFPTEPVLVSEKCSYPVG